MSLEPSVFGKQGQLFVVQTDHLSGEVIGTVIEDLYNAGAFNVQVIATITKKNRPGHLVFIDTAVGTQPEIESLIVNELGATGWHLLGTEHRHVATEVIEQKVVFAIGGEQATFTALVKRVKGQTSQVRPEHKSCLAIREALKERGLALSLTEINQEVIRQYQEQSLHDKDKQD